jgi:hypothetical protein
MEMENGHVEIPTPNSTVSITQFIHRINIRKQQNSFQRLLKWSQLHKNLGQHQLSKIHLGIMQGSFSQNSQASKYFPKGNIKDQGDMISASEIPNVGNLAVQSRLDKWRQRRDDNTFFADVRET